MDNSYNSQNPNFLSKQRPSSNNALYAIAGIVVLNVIVLILVIMGIIPISSSGSSNSSPGTPGTSISSPGASGSKGAPGPPGPPGIQGIQGIQGLIGLRGPPVKVTYHKEGEIEHQGSRPIHFQKESNNGYFILGTDRHDYLAIITLLNGAYTTIYRSSNSFGFVRAENSGDKVKVWCDWMDRRTAHVIAHWWD